MPAASPAPDIASLEARRRAVLAEIAALGDLRSGHLQSRLQKCGKKNCPYADDDARRHGPYWLLFSKGPHGRKTSRSVPSAQLDAVRDQLAEGQRLQRLVGELVAVCEQISDARLAGAASTPAAGKKACATQFVPAIADEVERLVGHGAAAELDFEAVEAAVRRPRRGPPAQPRHLRLQRPAPALPLRQRGTLRRAPAQDLPHRGGAADTAAGLLLLRRLRPGPVPTRPRAGTRAGLAVPGDAAHGRRRKR